MKQIMSNSEQINCILNNAQIYKYDFILYRYYCMIQNFNAIFEKIETGNIAVWGEENHIKILCSRLFSQHKKKLVCVINEKDKKIISTEKNYIAPNELDALSVDTIIITSWFKRRKIAEDIKKLKKTYNIIDLYDFLEQEKVQANVFYKGVDYSYDKIALTLGNLKCARTLKMERILTKKLIGEYFHIRDFSSAFLYIEKLEASGDEEQAFYSSIKKQLKKHLAKIGEKITGKDNLILNWIDALIPEDAENNMPFLTGLKKEGIYFNNAYTVVPFTSASIKTIFTRKLYLDDNLFELDLNKLDDCELYNLIVDNGYRFRYFGGVFKTGIFYNEKIEQYLILSEHEHLASTVYQWESVKELEESQQKNFIIIHNLIETHYPFVNGAQEDIQYKLGRQIYWKAAIDIKNEEFVRQKEQIKKSQMYMDRQLQFYMSLYRNIRFHIIMSDHGGYRWQLPIKCKEFYHTFLLLLGERLPQMEIDKMLSLRNLSKVTKSMFKKDVDWMKELKQYTDDYVIVQAEDGYSMDMVEVSCVNLEYMENIFIQRRGIITKEDMYFRDVLGMERYYIGDDMENEIDNKEYRERIEKLKKLAGDKFVDIRKYPKYINARRWYELWDYSIPDNTKFFE